MSDFPYPGLRPYERDETDLFFGREEHTDQLIKHLGLTHFLAVVGPSGCGKSSLVRTGLLAALESGFMASAGGYWRIAELRPGNQPFARLAEALLENKVLNNETIESSESTEYIALLQASLRRGPKSVHEILADTPLPDNTTLLLLVDQFEEIFRYYQQGDKNEAAAFVKLLLALRSHPDVYVVLTMRSDFIGDCATFYGLPEAINQGLFLTPRLTRDQLCDAIKLPASVFGDEVEPILVNHLLNEVGTAPDKLPQLQHALMRMWQLAHFENPDKATLSLTHYKQIGGLENALSQHADRAYADLNFTQQKLAEILFRSLCEKSSKYRDTRRPVKLSTVASLANVPCEEIIAVVEVFRQQERSFLTPPLGKNLTPNTVLDISHESLIRRWQRLKKWTDAEAKSATLYRRLEESAYRWHKGQAALWRRPDLETALTWRKKEHPNAVWAKRYGEHFDLAMRFLEASAKQQKQEEEQKQIEIERQHKLQRLQKQVAGTVLGLIVVVSLAVWGFWGRSKARLMQRVVTYESIISQATLLARDENYAEAKKVLKKSHQLDKKIPESHRHVRNLLVWFSELMGGEPLKEYNAGAMLFEVAVSPDGHFLAAAGEKGTLKLFDISHNQLSQQHTLLGHEGYVFTVAFHPQGEWLASAGNQKIILWSLSSNKPINKYKWIAPDKVNALAVSPDGKYLASGGDDKNITLREIETNSVSCILKGHRERISDGGLAFHPAGKLLASASSDRTARLWLVSTCEEYKTLLGHANSVEKLIFSPDGKTLATSSSDQTIRLWNVESGTLLRVLQGHQGEVYGLNFVENEHYLVSGSKDRTLRIWDIESGVTLRVLQGHSAAVNGVTSYADKILSASSNSTIMLWQTTLPHQQLIDLPSEPISVAIAPDGKSVAVGFMKGALHLYSLPNHHLLWKEQAAHDNYIREMAFNSDGTLLATASSDSHAKLWQVENATLTLKQTFRVHKNNISTKVSAVAFSPNDQFLATADHDGQIGFFAVGKEQKHFYQAADEGKISSIAFDLSGTRLLTSGRDGYARLWHVNGSQLTLLKKFPKAQNQIMWASFSPDGKWIATVGHEQLVRIYSTSDYQEKYRLEGHQDTVFRAIFSPDNQQIVTASADATIRFWDLKNGSELFVLNLPSRAYPVPLRDFDFRCTAQGCWIAVPLSRGKLALYELGDIWN
jgi:WD40 repeat protein